MRQVNDGLECPLKHLRRDLVQENRKGYRNENVHNQLCKCDNQGVDKNLPAVRKAENKLVVLKPHPLGSQKSLCRDIILECHEGADERDKYKEQKNDHTGKEH